MWGRGEENPQIFSEMDCRNLKDAESVDSFQERKRPPEGAEAVGRREGLGVRME